MSEATIKIDIHVNNDIEGFGAYLSPVNGFSLDDPSSIILNINACIVSAIEYEDSAKDVIIETLMHEFGHVLEGFFSLPHNEERIEGAVEAYREAINKQKPNQ